MPDSLDKSAKPDHTKALIQRRFSVAGGELCVGGIPVGSIAAEHGTPLFIYDQGIVEATFARLRQAYPSQFAIYYSVKANPNQAFLKFFLDKGCGLEVASGGEIHQALAAGCSPDRIVFAGPGKTSAELRDALSHDIGEIHVESLTEIERIARLSRESGKPAKIALRINPRASDEGGAMRMGGGPAPFGIDEESLPAALDRVLAEEKLDLRGVHIYAGTQILDHSILIKQYREALRLGRQVAERLGRPLKTIDVGGGLGVPYFAHERQLDLGRLSEGLAEIAETVAKDPLFAGTRFIVEPGRFLVAEAGLYVARVNDIKVSKGEKFVILDGGMHHHLAASGNLGQTIRRNFPVAVLNKLDRPLVETCRVVGPLCTPLDVMARGLSLPETEVGDLVGVFQSGAYARTSSPLGFLSHATPPEVWIEAGTGHLIRRRGQYADFLHDQCEAQPHA